MKSIWLPVGALTILAALSGCITTKHEVTTQHKIEPIHITVDVNLKVEKELDDFFEDLDEQSTLITIDDNQ